MYLRFIPCLEHWEVVKSVVQFDRSVGEFGDLGGPCVFFFVSSSLLTVFDLSRS